MRILSLVIICGLFALPFTSYSATLITPTSANTTPLTIPYGKIINLKIKDVQKIIGRKLTMKEKISFMILKHALKKKAKDAKQGQTALGFGIAAVVMLVVGLFVPFVIIGALVAGILAVVLGSVAKKQDSSDRKAYAATLLGWITLGCIALLLLLAIILVASWGWY